MKCWTLASLRQCVIVPFDDNGIASQLSFAAQIPKMPPVSIEDKKWLLSNSITVIIGQGGRKKAERAIFPHTRTCSHAPFLRCSGVPPPLFHNFPAQALYYINHLQNFVSTRLSDEATKSLPLTSCLRLR